MAKVKHLSESESRTIFEKGFKDYSYAEMVGFSRYAFRQGWSKGKIEKHIRTECFKNGMNLVLNQPSIHKAVLSSKYDFLEQEEVIITKEEILQISKLKNRRWEKALFAILVFSKKYGTVYKTNLYFWLDVKEVIKRVGVHMKLDEYHEFLTTIGKEKKLVNAVVRKKKLSWRISFAKDDGEFFCQIKDFSRVQDYLPNFCNTCGKEVWKRKFCDEHRPK
jgi:hypothetical protein